MTLKENGTVPESGKGFILQSLAFQWHGSSAINVTELTELCSWQEYLLKCFSNNISGTA
jgi:hypothetical protein